MPGQEKKTGTKQLKDQHGRRGRKGKDVNKEGDEEIWICKLCNSHMADDDVKALECEVCNERFCIGCVNMDEAQYELLNTFPTMHWYCLECDPKITRSINVEKIIMEKFTVMEEKMEEKFKKLESAVNNKASIEAVDQMFLAIENINRQVNRELNDVKKKMEAEKEQVMSYGDALKVEMEKKSEAKYGEVRSVMEKEVVEATTRQVQGRMDRRNNIVLYGAPEEIKSDLSLWLRSEKIKHDKAIVMELCLELEVECYVDDISEIKRVGRYNRPSSPGNGSEARAPRPRPIIVTLKEGIKEKIMANVYRLKNKKNEMLKMIRVSHDMTVDERQKDKKLRMEAKEKNENESEQGNFFYVVRGNPWERCILKLKKRQPRKTSDPPQSQVQQEEGAVGGVVV